MADLLGANNATGYVRTVWQNEVTPIDADHLNNIEEGISDLYDTVAEIDTLDDGEVGIGTDPVEGQAVTFPHSVTNKVYLGSTPIPAIYISTADPTESDGINGDVWIKYTV